MKVCGGGIESCAFYCTTGVHNCLIRVTLGVSGIALSIYIHVAWANKEFVAQNVASDSVFLARKWGREEGEKRHCGMCNQKQVESQEIKLHLRPCVICHFFLNNYFHAIQTKNAPKILTSHLGSLLKVFFLNFFFLKLLQVISLCDMLFLKLNLSLFLQQYYYSACYKQSR